MFKSLCLVGLLIFMPISVSAEKWIEFHSVKWSQKSGKLKKKLNYSSRFYFDADNILKDAGGDVTLWVKEESENDRFYVKKGNPVKESVFRRVHLWCALKKYEIIIGDETDLVFSETMSEEIEAGSYYEKIYNVACKKKD